MEASAAAMPVSDIQARIRSTYHRQAYALAWIVTATLIGTCASLIVNGMDAVTGLMLLLDLLQIAAGGYIFMAAAGLRRELNVMLALKRQPWGPK